MKYTVNEAAKKLNMTVHTIRHYTDKGLVPCLMRDENDYRVFDEEGLRWLKAAQFLRKSGLSVDEIAQYFELCQRNTNTFQERYEMLLTLQERTEKEYEDVLARKKYIEGCRTHFEKIITGIEKDVCNPLYWDIVPQKEEDIFK